MSDASLSYYADLKAAATATDLQGVQSILASLQETSIPTLLTELRTAIENGQTEEAKLLLEQLASKYQSGRARRNATLAAVRVGRETEDVTFETQKQLTQTLRTALDNDLRRTKVLSQVETYLTSDSGPDMTTVTSTIDATKQSEETTQARLDDAQTQLEDESLPPHVDILTTQITPASVAVNEPATLTVTIGNVGDADASAVALRVSLPSGLTVPTESITVGTLAGGVNVEETLSVTGTAAGEYTIETEVTSDNAGTATETAFLSVTGATGGLIAQYDKDGDGQIDNQELLTALADYPEQVSSQDLLDLLAVYNPNA